jgi:hypothetical protein
MYTAVYRRAHGVSTTVKSSMGLSSAEVFHLDDEGLATDVRPIFDTDPWRKATEVVPEQNVGSDGVSAWWPGHLGD